MKSGEHGPDKLFDKFRVFKTKTGEELTGRGEFMFVLRPETNDQAAIMAIYEYARACEGVYPQLAQDLRKELRRIDEEVIIEMVENEVSADQACRNRSDRRSAPPLMIPPTSVCPHCGSNGVCPNILSGRECLLEGGNG